MNNSIKKIAIIDDCEKWISLAENYIKKIDASILITKHFNGFDFVEWCYKNKQLPEIALIDVEMPKMDGVQLTDFLTTHYPEIKIIAISSYGEKDTIEDMIGCGALGYVSKIHEMNNLPFAISDISNGLVYIDPVLRIKNICRKSLREKRNLQSGELKLTLKQKEIIALYTTSAKQHEIANALCISPKTFENRVKSVSELLNVTNRQQFTLKSLGTGFTRMARFFKSSSSPSLYEQDASQPIQ